MISKKIRNMRRNLVVLAVAFPLLYVGFQFVSVMRDRRTAIEDAMADTHSMASALDEHANRTIGEADRLLQSAIDDIERSKVPATAAQARTIHELLKRYTDKIPQLIAINAVDANGEMIASGLAFPGAPSNFRDREYFRFHRIPGNSGLFISRPVKSRTSDRWVFTISRAITNADGSLKMILVAGIPLDYFEAFYRSLHIGKGSRLLLDHKNGWVLTESSMTERLLNKDVSASKVFDAIRSASSSSGSMIIEKSPIDGTRRILSYAGSPSYPIVAVASFSEAEVLKPWRGRLQQTVFVGMVSIAIMLGLIAILWRLLDELFVAHDSLQKQNESLAKSEQRYQELVNGIDGIVWEARLPDLRFTYVSANACKFTGYAAGEWLTNPSFWQEKLDTDPGRLRDAIARAPKESMHALPPVDHHLRSHDGKDIWLRNNMTVATDCDGTPRIFGVMVDTTARKIAEEELLRHKEHLEEMVAARTAQLNVALTQAQAANRAKSTFLSHMSHEIRTPMNAILGYTQIMLRQPDLPPHLRRFVDIIDNSGDHLLALINDVLEMSKIEAGRATLQDEEFNFRAVMGEVESMLYARAAEKGLKLEVRVDDSVPPAMRADMTKLRQILVNLVGNAIKFTERGSVTVQASASCGGADAAAMRITISDTGPGIADADLAKIFDAFEQVGGGQHKGGSGLGMTISRSYARMMGGDLSVDSRLGHGTAVHLTFTVTAAAGAAAPQSSRGDRVIGLAAGTPVPKVMVVDDIASNRDVLAAMLASAGFGNVREAADGDTALAMVRDWRPDIVLMDRRMPGKDGLEVIAAIRALPYGEAVRIIMVTASTLEEDRQIALACGADGFVSKPFREEELYQEIQRVYPALAYRYEEATPAPLPETRAGYRSEVAKIDTALLAELVDLIECGDVMRFEQAIDRHLRERSPALYRRLYDLAQKFDYAPIVAILTSSMEA